MKFLYHLDMLIFAADQWLIKMFQNISHQIQKITGRDNFFLAWCIGILSAVCFASAVATTKGTSTEMKAVFATFTFVLSLVGVIYVTKTIEQLTKRKMASAQLVMNPCQINPLIIVGRMGCSINTMMFIVLFPKLAANIGTTSCIFFLSTTLCLSAWVYLLCCTPLPPCESKLKKWAKSLGQGLRNLIPRPATSPAPA